MRLEYLIDRFRAKCYRGSPPDLQKHLSFSRVRRKLLKWIRYFRFRNTALLRLGSSDLYLEYRVRDLGEKSESVSLASDYVNTFLPLSPLFLQVE